MDFDYSRAWHELALPAWQALPQNVRDLFLDVAQATADLQQDRDLLIPRPPGDVWPRMEELPSEVLAQAAQVIYDLGHWLPGAGRELLEPNVVAALAAGGYWKFSNLVDQILREKAGLPRSRCDSPRGLSFEIHEGFLRACFSSKEEWRWEEIGLGTKEILERARVIGGPVMTRSFGKLTAQLRRELLPPGLIGRFFDLSDFDKDPRARAMSRLRGVLPPPGWKAREIMPVNFRPHPFVVTPRHFERSTGMYLDPNVAPCGHPDCREAHDKHTHDRVVMIEVPPDAPEGGPAAEPVQAWLKQLAAVLEEPGFVALAGKVDGFVFAKVERPTS